ncbi:hypothetical protein pipiens_002983 [Culex pipiens pipiens]|uniref:Uncharacterized protein n=1 Tax=Culex pipiens pipiens TaxID=38569 RepID=A0ABD1D6S3_CULPP
MQARIDQEYEDDRKKLQLEMEMRYENIRSRVEVVDESIKVGMEQKEEGKKKELRDRGRQYEVGSATAKATEKTANVVPEDILVATSGSGASEEGTRQSTGKSDRALTSSSQNGEAVEFPLEVCFVKTAVLTRAVSSLNHASPTIVHIPEILDFSNHDVTVSFAFDGEFQRSIQESESLLDKRKASDEGSWELSKWEVNSTEQLTRLDQPLYVSASANTKRCCRYPGAGRMVGSLECEKRKLFTCTEVRARPRWKLKEQWWRMCGVPTSQFDQSDTLVRYGAALQKIYDPLRTSSSQIYRSGLRYGTFGWRYTGGLGWADVRALRMNWKSSPGQNHMETRYAQKTYLVRMTCGIVRCRRQCTMRKLDKHARGQPDSRGTSGNRAVLIRQPANNTQVHNNTGRRNFHVLIEGFKSATLRGEEADRKPKWTVKEPRQGKIDQAKLTKELGVEDRDDDGSKFSPNYERYQVGNVETAKHKFKVRQLGEPFAVRSRSKWKVRGMQAPFVECAEDVLLPLGHFASLEMPLEVFWRRLGKLGEYTSGQQDQRAQPERRGTSEKRTVTDRQPKSRTTQGEEVVMEAERIPKGNCLVTSYAIGGDGWSQLKENDKITTERSDKDRRTQSLERPLEICMSWDEAGTGKHKMGTSGLIRRCVAKGKAGKKPLRQAIIFEKLALCSKAERFADRETASTGPKQRIKPECNKDGKAGAGRDKSAFIQTSGIFSEGLAKRSRYEKMNNSSREPGEAMRRPVLRSEIKVDPEEERKRICDLFGEPDEEEGLLSSEGVKKYDDNMPVKLDNLDYKIKPNAAGLLKVEVKVELLKQEPELSTAR